MAKFCPEWVFSASVAGVAGGFLSGNAPITVFANQFSNGINEHIQKLNQKYLKNCNQNFRILKRNRSWRNCY